MRRGGAAGGAVLALVALVAGCTGGGAPTARRRAVVRPRAPLQPCPAQPGSRPQGTALPT